MVLDTVLRRDKAQALTTPSSLWHSQVRSGIPFFNQQMSSFMMTNFLNPITPSNFPNRESPPHSSGTLTAPASESTEPTAVSKPSADPAYIDERSIAHWIDPFITEFSGKKRRATEDPYKTDYWRPFFSVANLIKDLANQAHYWELDVDAATVKPSFQASVKAAGAFPVSALTRAWYMPSDWDLPQGDAYPEPGKPGICVSGQKTAVQDLAPKNGRSSASRTTKSDLRWRPYEPVRSTRHQTRTSPVDDDMMPSPNDNDRAGPIGSRPSRGPAGVTPVLKQRSPPAWTPYDDREPTSGWKFAPPKIIACPAAGCSSSFAMSAYGDDIHAYKRTVYEHLARHASDDRLHHNGRILCFVPDCADGYFEPHAHVKHVADRHLKLNVVRCEACEKAFCRDDKVNVSRHQHCDPTLREQNLRLDPSTRSTGRR